VLSTSEQTRIPKGDPYSAVVVARGGSGVVVGRVVAAPGAPQAPQVGLANAVDALTAGTQSRHWVVPGPGSSRAPVVTGATPVHLAVTNLTGRHESYTVAVMTPSGIRTISSGTLAPSATAFVNGPTLARAGLDPLLVTTGGAAAVSEDVGPTGAYGAVTMPGIALAHSSGG
jgi:hypothetical protein